jgi:hypothetical protein
MPRGQTQKITCFFFLALTGLFLSPTCCAAVTRGDVVQIVVDALGLPLWGGKERFADVPSTHPRAKAIETASALGILLPGDRFHPDIEATRAEALGFAFLAMGWRREGELVRTFATDLDAELPPHFAAFVKIGRSMTVPPPEEFLSEAKKNCTPGDADLLAAWLRECKRRRVVWQETFPGETGDLVVHRENVGSPPGAWAIAVEEFPEKGAAEACARELRSAGHTALIVENASSWSVRTGPYTHYLQAWKAAVSLPKRFNPTVIPHGGSASNALFWAAIVGSPERLAPRIVPAPLLGAKRLPLSRLADGFGGEGGINGGYFDGSVPIGSLLVEGVPVALAHGNRSAVGWNRSGDVHFGNGAYRAWVLAGAQSLPVSKLNGEVPPESAGLFTAPSGAFANVGDGLKIHIRNGVMTWRSFAQGIHPVPGDGFLLVVRGALQKRMMEFPLQTPAELQITWQDGTMERMDFVLQAGPLLLLEGQPALGNEGLPPSLTALRHPRTLVGYDGKHMWWMVVDGRNSWRSTGVTLEEAKRLAAAAGLTHALNLDGGGSSTLWWRGKLINTPSDGQERSLPYAVVLGSNMPYR